MNCGTKWVSGGIAMLGMRVEHQPQQGRAGAADPDDERGGERSGSDALAQAAPAQESDGIVEGHGRPVRIGGRSRGREAARPRRPRTRACRPASISVRQAPVRAGRGGRASRVRVSARALLGVACLAPPAASRSPSSARRVVGALVVAEHGRVEVRARSSSQIAPQLRLGIGDEVLVAQLHVAAIERSRRLLARILDPAPPEIRRLGHRLVGAHPAGAPRERDVAAVANQVDEPRLGQHRGDRIHVPSRTPASSHPTSACPGTRRRGRRTRAGPRRGRCIGGPARELVGVEAEVAPGPRRR